MAPACGSPTAMPSRSAECSPANIGRVKLVLGCHLVQNLGLIAMSMLDFFLSKHHLQSVGRLCLEIVVAGYAVIGIPIILLGFWGVCESIKRYVKVYLSYAVMGILITMVCAVEELRYAPCRAPDPTTWKTNLELECKAFLLFPLVMGLIQLFMVYPVFSYCADLLEEHRIVCKEEATKSPPSDLRCIRPFGALLYWRPCTEEIQRLQDEENQHGSVPQECQYGTMPGLPQLPSPPASPASPTSSISMSWPSTMSPPSISATPLMPGSPELPELPELEQPMLP